MDSATKIVEAGPTGAIDEHHLHAISHDLITPVIQKWIDEGKQDPEAFWGRAAEQLPWFRKWDRVLEWTRPTFKWFVGGQTNLAYNALDYHVKRGRGGHTALIYLNERGERRVYTYAHLLHEVEQVAAALRGSETILVLEDEARVRKLVCEVLAGRGYQVLEAVRGEEAIRMAAEHHGSVHLLLTDVVMPEMSGPQVLEQIRARHPNMKVLFMSGYTDEAMVHHGILDSGAPFLQKPFLPDALARKVREVLTSSASAG